MKPPIVLTTRIKVGLAFIYLAGLGWTAELIIPFLNIPNKVTLLIVVLAAAETSFLVGIAILGKPTYKAIKARIVESIRNRGQRPE